MWPARRIVAKLKSCAPEGKRRRGSGLEASHGHAQCAWLASARRTRVAVRGWCVRALGAPARELAREDAPVLPLRRRAAEVVHVGLPCGDRRVGWAVAPQREVVPEERGVEELLVLPLKARE